MDNSCVLHTSLVGSLVRIVYNNTNSIGFVLKTNYTCITDMLLLMWQPNDGYGKIIKNMSIDKFDHVEVSPYVQQMIDGVENITLKDIRTYPVLIKILT